MVKVQTDLCRLRCSPRRRKRVRLSQGNRWLYGIFILTFLLGIANKYTCFFVNFRGIEPHKINEGESMYPTPPYRVGRGSYSSPKPPRKIKLATDLIYCSCLN